MYFSTKIWELVTAFHLQVTKFPQILECSELDLCFKLSLGKIKSKKSVKSHFYRIYDSEINVSKPLEMCLPFLYFVHIFHNETE